MRKKIMIIDGNSILFRAFYAMPPLKTKKGQYTNAVYGFLNMLYKLMDDYVPEYICVAFDPKKPTFRHVQYKDYKAGRAKAPDELVSQFELIREVLRLHDISCIEIEGYEADDVAGTIANEFKKKGIGVYLVTSDKDYLQLVDDDVKVLLTKKGVTNIKEMGRNEILEDYEIKPEEFVDLKALMGDKSDNIPGVAGVGEKTAIKLIKEYHNLDNLYNHIDEIKGKLKEKLENDKMQAYMSKTLAQIVTEIPIEMVLEEFIVKKADNSVLWNLYDELEFKNFKKRIKRENISSDNSKSIDISEDNSQMSIFNMVSQDKSSTNNIDEKFIHVCKSDMISINNIDDDNFTKLVENIKKEKQVVIKFLLDNDRALFSEAVSLCMYSGNGKIYYIMLNKENKCSVLSQLKSIFEDESIKKIGHDLKSDIIFLLKNDIEMKGISFDSEIAAYLIDPSENSYSIDKLLSKYSEINIKSTSEYVGTGKNKLSFADIDDELRQQYLFDFINAVSNLKAILENEIQKLGMQDLFMNIEMPLIMVLASMEYEGFRVNTEVLNELGEKFNKKLAVLENSIIDMAGEKFNINSTKQLGKILFEKLNLKVIKKTKTGYSTDAEVLEKLKNSHPIIESIIEYRQLTKLNSTYIEGLKNEIKYDGRVHSVLNQTITTTGRISSTEPNLQNIPTRTDEGKEIRKAFVANESCKLVDADYSQIELRVLAELSNEDNLIDAFAHHEDIHAKTASEVFKVNLDDVTPAMRSRAKAVNFGIIYGISDYGLGRDLNIPRKEAKEYIESYLEYYKNIDIYMKKTIDQGKKDLYVETYFGRRRNIPELNSRNFNIRSFGERIALNTPIQGTAADIIKMAMINVFNRIKQEKLKSKLLLQIHDELIIEATVDEVDKVIDILKSEMENVVDNFRVKLEVDVNVGDSWYESK